MRAYLAGILLLVGVLYKLYLFRGFLQVPFLWEIRAILDWTVANTSLELFSYIKLEDIHTGLCIVRANMLYRRAYKRGVAIPKLDKSYMGFLAVLALLLVVTGPLLIFSSASPISEPNPLVGASARLSLIAAPRAALARTSRGELDHSHSDFEIASISRLQLVALDPHHALLTNEFHLHHCQDARSEVEIYRSCGYRYLFGDSSDNFQRLKFEKEADLHWQITPGSRRALAEALIQSSMQVEVSLQVTFERALAIGGSTRNSLARTRALSKSQKEQLFRALIPSNDSLVRPAVVRLELRELFPKFIRLPSVAEAEPFAITGTMHQWHTWQTLALSWRSGHNVADRPWGAEWWELQQAAIDASPFNTSLDDGLQVVVAGERLAGGSAAIAFTAGGVLAFYALVVFGIGRVVRAILRGTRYRIIVDEMPDTRDLIDLCEGVYIARQEGKLMHETELHETILRMYRSPVLMLQLTGDKLER